MEPEVGDAGRLELLELTLDEDEMDDVDLAEIGSSTRTLTSVFCLSFDTGVVGNDAARPVSVFFIFFGEIDDVDIGIGNEADFNGFEIPFLIILPYESA